MTTTWQGVLPLVLAALPGLALAGSGAAAQGNCEWYARTAVRQQQINEEKKCGFKGEAWHKDLAAHLKWCASVAPDLWKSEAQKRNQQLEVCGKR
jgi:hypothetical protein